MGEAPSGSTHAARPAYLVVAVAAHGPASRHAAALQADARYSPVTAERLLSPEPHNWPMYRRTYDGWGYSPLDRITRANVASLVPVWTFSTGSDRDHQSPPIVNDGHMFVTAPLDSGGLQVLALEAATGDLRWRYVRELPADARKHRNKVNRGVALYGDKVFVGTADAAVVALDAVTGQVVWEQRIADPAVGHYVTMAPLAVDGKIMVGVSGGGFGIRGFVVALDADTGREVWKTHTVPAPGEPGSGTWPGETWRTGGAPVWVTATYDPALNQVYWGTGNPGPWMGDARPGDNLYTNSVLALDAATGAIAGYHQYHHNGSWDWDEADPPLVLDVERDGRTIPSLVHPGRNGYLWLLERSADGIGFVDATPYVHQNVFTAIDACAPGAPRTTPHAFREPADAPCSARPTRGARTGSRRPSTRRPGSSTFRPTRTCARRCRATRWSTRRESQFVGVRLELQIRDGAGHVGELQAWDLDAGKRVWRRTFPSHNVGPILTTAGGLVFMGGTSDRFFRAFDADVGRGALAIPHQLRRHRCPDGLCLRPIRRHRRRLPHAVERGQQFHRERLVERTV